MVANAQSQPITSLPVDSGASRGNQPLLPSEKRSTRDFTIAPVERSSAGTLPLLQKTKMCTPVPAKISRRSAPGSHQKQSKRPKFFRRYAPEPCKWCKKAQIFPALRAGKLTTRFPHTYYICLYSPVLQPGSIDLISVT